MMKHVKWSVTEIANGSDPVDGIRDGDRTIIASGEVDKKGKKKALRASLLTDLQKAFPRTEMRGTYSVDRIYDIDIT